MWYLLFRSFYVGFSPPVFVYFCIRRLVVWTRNHFSLLFSAVIVMGDDKEQFSSETGFLLAFAIYRMLKSCYFSSPIPSFHEVVQNQLAFLHMVFILLYCLISYRTLALALVFVSLFVFKFLNCDSSKAFLFCNCGNISF